MSRATGGRREGADDSKEVVPLSLQKLRDLAESLKASMPVRCRLPRARPSKGGRRD